MSQKSANVDTNVNQINVDVIKVTTVEELSECDFPVFGTCFARTGGPNVLSRL